MLKFFKSKNPLIIIFYPIIAFGFVYFNSAPYDVNELFIGKPYICKHFLLLLNGPYFNSLYIFFSVLFLSVNGFFFNQLIRNLKIVKFYQNLHGFIFLLLIGLFFRFFEILQVSLSLFFFLITISLIIKSLRKKIAVFDFFNAGFALSVASFFWFQILYFYPIIIFGLIIFRKLNFREILTSLIGLFIPWFFFFSIYFFIHSNFDLIYDIFQLIVNKHSEFKPDLNSIVYGIPIIIILLISSFHILGKYRSTESDIQDYYIFWFLLFLLASTYLIFLHKNDYSFLIIMLMSAAVPVGVYFSETKRPLAKEIIFDLFLLAVILSQFHFFG